MTILEKYANLIEYLITCDNKCHEEIDKRIESGEIDRKDSVLLEFHVKSAKIVKKLDAITEKIS